MISHLFSERFLSKWTNQAKGGKGSYRKVLSIFLKIAQ